MKPKAQDPAMHASSYFTTYLWIALGSFIAAFAIKIFFIPNMLIDGGTVGLAMITANVFGAHYLPLFLLLYNIPFIYLAYRHIGKTFVAQLAFSVLMFAIFLFLMPYIFHTPFHGDNLEVVVIGGAILGVGIGIIIRGGASLDGTEILGIIFNKKKGFTVGQTVFFCNIFVFSLAGVVFQDWHPPLLSLIAYVVVVKIMDLVIVGLDEMKSVLIISEKPGEVAQALMHEMGLGLTIMYGRRGFSGASCELLYIVIERLQLADLKTVIFTIDPNAFLAIENLHEISAGHPVRTTGKKKSIF